MRDELLFNKYSWFSVEQNQITQLKDEVANFHGDRLLNTSVDDLCQYFIDKYRIDVPILKLNEIVADQRETKVDVSNDYRYFGDRSGQPVRVDGSTVEITVPFQGDREVFNVQPTTYSLNPPRADITDGALILRFTGVNQTPVEVKGKIEKALKDIETNLENLRGTATRLNSSIGQTARDAINSRREKLLANQNLVSSLGYQLKQSVDTPQTYSAPNVRRKLRPTAPTASKAPYTPEPELMMEDYEHILNVIHNMALVMERSPSAFKRMDEEALRTHFLVQLNGHYEGEASGETFNYEGKTDILIRSGGKNIFIGECKFWGGPKLLNDTIDQLLGYSAWRDTKVAVLVFNRNKDLSKVIESAKKVTLEHPNCKRFIDQKSDTHFRYIFAHRDDDNREMTLSLKIFDVPH
ncbi:MAG: hypothetical protein GYB58_14790 [Gammaproteobacteria bacterium]|nr:hypothetical protein [Gammaproteobacteria bacterium]